MHALVLGIPIRSVEFIRLKYETPQLSSVDLASTKDRCEWSLGIHRFRTDSLQARWLSQVNAVIPLQRIAPFRGWKAAVFSNGTDSQLAKAFLHVIEAGGAELCLHIKAEKLANDPGVIEGITNVELIFILSPMTFTSTARKAIFASSEQGHHRFFPAESLLRHIIRADGIHFTPDETDQEILNL